MLPVVGAGVAAFYLAHTGSFSKLGWLFWATFVLTQFVNINLGQPGTSFDPNQLIRFPLSLRHFVLLHLFFGLLSPANILVTGMGFATAVGLTLANPHLWPFVFFAVLVFTLVNVLFSRMVFAWVDRWLSTRRAREIFTAFVFIASIGFQYVNLSFNTGSSRPHSRGANLERWQAMGRAYDRARPVLAVLPPELTASALRSAQAGQSGAFTAQTSGCALYGVLFLSVFALRMRTEFRGEALSDQAVGGSASAALPKPAAPTAFTAIASSTTASATPKASGWLSPVVRAVLSKELLYTRRNVGVFYSLIAPLAMVFIFAGRMATRNSTPWVFPVALAYTLLGVMPLSFNSFGLEGTGSQFYFLAPVRLREVVFAKNLLGFGLAALEALVTVIIVIVTVGTPSVSLLLPSVLWAAATLLLGTSVGNLRSLSAPRQIKLSKVSGKQASPLSALMSVGILLVSSGIGGCVLIAAKYSHLAWLPLAIFLAFFGVALVIYRRGLSSLDRYALAHREQLFTELCKS